MSRPDFGTIVARTRQLLNGDIDSRGEILAELRDRRDGFLTARALDKGCIAALNLGMMAMRLDNDPTAALVAFRRGLPFARQLLDSHAEGLFGTAWHSHAPLHLCMFCKEFDLADALASMTLDLPRPKSGQSDDSHEAFGRMLAATVLDDAARLELWRGQLPKKLLYWWQCQIVYADLYQAIVERNKVRFDLLMQQRDEAFKLRLTDKKFGDARMEFGGRDENRFVIDFMGLGAAIMAIRRGMAVVEDTWSVPMVLVE